MTSRVDNLRRILCIIKHFDPNWESQDNQDVQKFCKICGKNKLYPYRSNMRVLELDGDYHSICIEANKYQEFETVNELYYSVENNKISKIF